MIRIVEPDAVMEYKDSDFQDGSIVAQGYYRQEDTIPIDIDEMAQRIFNALPVTGKHLADIKLVIEEYLQERLNERTTNNF